MSNLSIETANQFHLDCIARLRSAEVAHQKAYDKWVRTQSTSKNYAQVCEVLKQAGADLYFYEDACKVALHALDNVRGYVAR